MALASIRRAHFLHDRVLGVAVLVLLGALLSSCAGRSTLRSSALANLVVPFAPLCDNADSFIFCGWSKNREWTSSRSKVPPKRCLFSIPPPSQDCSFPLGLGRERL